MMITTRAARLALPTLCSWCDEDATYNLHTDRDQACFDHFKKWFAPGWEEARILAAAV